MTQGLQDVLVAAENTHQGLHWLVGVVTAVDAANHKATVAYGPSPVAGHFVLDEGTPGIDYLEQLTLAVGMKVHMLSHEDNGILIIGSLGTAPVGRAGMLQPAPAPMPDPPAIVVRSLTSDTLLQGAGTGAASTWSFDDLLDKARTARKKGVITSAELELTLLGGGPRAMLILVGADGRQLSTAHRTPRLVPNTPTKVPLPLGWIHLILERRLEDVQIGVVDTPDAPRAAFAAESMIVFYTTS